MANCVQCGRQLPAFSFKKICQWCVQHEAAQRGEVGEDAKQRVMPAPWVRREATITLTRVIFGINVAVFLGMVLATGDPLAFANPLQDFSSQLTLHWGANLAPLTFSGEWWRLLTCVFVHGSLLHIAFNMWCLWNLGALSESLYGRWTYLTVYLISGAGASLVSAAWHTLGPPSVGASGAIFGLAGALIAAFKLGEFSIPRSALSGTMRSLAMFVLYNLVFGAAIGSTDNAAHIGGLVTGLILGALIARIAPEHDRPLRRAGVLLFVTLLVGGSALGVQRWRGYPMHFALSAGYRQNDVNRMIADLQKKIQRNPQDASARYSLAHAYFEKGQFSEGEAELRRVLELQPQNKAAEMDLGAAYLTQGQAKEAQQAFTKLLALDPNHVGGHVGLGMALADQQNHQGAVEEYRAALKLDPQSRGVYHQLGISQAHLNQYDEAIVSYLKEREQSGDDADLEAALADAYQAKGMQQQAQDARNKAAQLKSRDTD